MGRRFSDKFREAQEPRRVERRLLVMRIEPENLENLSIADGGTNLDLPILEEYFGPDYTAVSHTFDLQATGVGILSILFERPKPG